MTSGACGIELTPIITPWCCNESVYIELGAVGYFVIVPDVEASDVNLAKRLSKGVFAIVLMPIAEVMIDLIWRRGVGGCRDGALIAVNSFHAQVCM